MSFFSRLFSGKPGHPAAPTTARAPGPKVVSHSVAGTSYRQEAIGAMGIKNPDYLLTKRELLKKWPYGVTVYEYIFDPQRVSLAPEPDNPKDPRAIRVLLDGVHVGYIKAGSCAHIHRLIREGRIVAIEPKIIGGKYKAVYSYEVGARRPDDFELEKGETPISVRLEIAELPAAGEGGSVNPVRP